MKQRFLFLAALAVAFVFSINTASAQTNPGLNPEKVIDQKAVYDAKANTVTITGKAPSRTIYDWDYYYEDFPLDHISYISIKRHTPGTEWPTTETGRVENPELGKTFTYVDTNVEPDKQYEYSMTVVVDALSSQESYLQVYTGLTPGPVSNFTATTKSPTTTTVDFTVTAPDTAVTGESLQGMPLSIRLQENTGWNQYADIDTIENVQPGQTISFSKDGFELNSTYRFRVLAYLGNEGKGGFEQTDLFVGLDRPGTPLNFKTQPDGNSVLLSWNAPATGDRGGSYAPETVTYTLTRVFSDGTKQVAARNIKTTEYTDTPDFDEENAISYELVGSNLSGSSYNPAKSDTVTIGPASKLPFTESFAKAALAHKGWRTATTEVNKYWTPKTWDFISTGYLYYYPTDSMITIEPQDADGGLAQSQFDGTSKEGQTESLTSPHIDVTGKSAVTLTFFHYYIPDGGSHNELKVYVSKDDGEWEEAFTSKTLNGNEPQWRLIGVPVSLVGNSKVQFKFDAIEHGNSPQSVYIDNIKVEEGTAAGINSIKTVEDTTGSKAIYNLSGQRVSDSYKGIVISNGKKYIAK